MYNFDPAIAITTSVPVVSGTTAFTKFMVHRVNLPDAAKLRAAPQLKDLTGSKSGIAVLDSERRTVLLPPGTSAEVDFWVLGAGTVVVTHNNPEVARIAEYPTLEEFLGAWNVKRELETSLNAPHGVILANLKTHGKEEWFIDRCGELGIPAGEIVLLDQELPATDRLMREKKYGSIAPLALRVSRLETLECAVVAIEQSSIFSPPRAVFYDPVGQEDSKVYWPFEAAMVKRMYAVAPDIEFILCCPSRWGKREQINQLADRLKAHGLRAPLVMTDIDLIPVWSKELAGWDDSDQEVKRLANY